MLHKLVRQLQLLIQVSVVPHPVQVLRFHQFVVRSAVTHGHQQSVQEKHQAILSNSGTKPIHTKLLRFLLLARLEDGYYPR
jgi:hypothetical protein